MDKWGKQRKVATINGRDWKEGNTSILINTVLKELKNEGIETEVISFAGKGINPCKTCFTCDGKNQCTFNHDIFNEVFEKIKRVDGIS